MGIFGALAAGPGTSPHVVDALEPTLEEADALAARLEVLPEVRAIPGRGLEGDRYFLGQGHYSDRPSPGGREVTLGDLQEMGMTAGINALITGNYLTTLGRSPQQDVVMLRGVKMPIGTLSKVI